MYFLIVTNVDYESTLSMRCVWQALLWVMSEFSDKKIIASLNLKISCKTKITENRTLVIPLVH